MDLHDMYKRYCETEPTKVPPTSQLDDPIEPELEGEDEESEDSDDEGEDEGDEPEE